MLTRTLSVSLLVALLAPVACQAERVALLLGNSDYARPELDLVNPVNDVTALSEALRGNGFEVIEATDLDAEGMRAALAAFATKSEDAELALFFYAGHGVQMGGDNLLVGVGFDGASREALEQSSMTMREVRDTMVAAGADASLIILDACRDAPFLDTEGARSGLVRTSGGAGLLIAYSTDPGNVAYDGEGNNSVFTAALLDHINSPGLDVRLMLGRVRQAVVVETYGQQVPWVEEALIGEHVISTQPVDATQNDALADEVRMWRAAFSSPETGLMQAYLDSYPQGMFADVARERLTETVSLDPTDVAAAEATVAGQDLDALAAALTLLGRPVRAEPEAVSMALAQYLSERPNLDVSAVGPVFEDAARSATILAAATAQQMRSDLVALRSIDRVLRVSENALGEIEAIAEENPDALPVLEQARSDVNDITVARGRVLNRLDQSRSYYQYLLDQSAVFLPDHVPAGLIDTTTGTGDVIDQRVRLDAQLFLDHVLETDPLKKGSYAWLADFLQQG
jgi:hypothetical protein